MHIKNPLWTHLRFSLLINLSLAVDFKHPRVPNADKALMVRLRVLGFRISATSYCQLSSTTSQILSVFPFHSASVWASVALKVSSFLVFKWLPAVGFTYARNSHRPFLSVSEYILIRILRYVYQTRNTDESAGQQCKKKAKRARPLSTLLWVLYCWPGMPFSR